MTEGETYFATALRHVEEGARRISDLKERIVELELHGHADAAAVAKDLLRTLQETQRLAIEHLRIERELHPPGEA